MSSRQHDWLLFLAVAATFSTLHIMAAFAVGFMPTRNTAEGWVFYATKGCFGPLLALLLVGVSQIASRVFNSAWMDRPGRAAWRIGLTVAILSFLSASETQALFK